MKITKHKAINLYRRICMDCVYDHHLQKRLRSKAADHEQKCSFCNEYGVMVSIDDLLSELELAMDELGWEIVTKGQQKQANDLYSKMQIIEGIVMQAGINNPYLYSLIVELYSSDRSRYKQAGYKEILINKDKFLEDLKNIFREYGKNYMRAGTRVFRGRIDEGDLNFDDIIKTFGPAPEGDRFNNRTSTSKEETFFCCSSKITVINELKRRGSNIVIAEFKTKQGMYIIDLTRLKTPSPFDRKHSVIELLGQNLIFDFIDSFSRPIADDDINKDGYILPETFTKKIRESFISHNILGIKYNSIDKDTEGVVGRNYAFFLNEFNYMEYFKFKKIINKLS